jgi:hypothetical protein
MMENIEEECSLSDSQGNGYEAQKCFKESSGTE